MVLFPGHFFFFFSGRYLSSSGRYKFAVDLQRLTCIFPSFSRTRPRLRLYATLYLSFQFLLVNSVGKLRLFGSTPPYLFPYFLFSPTRLPFRRFPTLFNSSLKNKFTPPFPMLFSTSASPTRKSLHFPAFPTILLSVISVHLYLRAQEYLFGFLLNTFFRPPPPGQTRSFLQPG